MRRKVANARIDLRTTPQRKSFFEFAAVLGKYDSLSSFMTEASEILAKKVFEEAEESRELSDADRDLLLKILNKAPEPNAALKAAFERVSKISHLDENGDMIYEVELPEVNKPLLSRHKASIVPGKSIVVKSTRDKGTSSRQAGS